MAWNIKCCVAAVVYQHVWLPVVCVHVLFISRTDTRHVTNWQMRSTDKQLLHHFLSPYFTFYGLTCTVQLFLLLAAFEKLVLQTYRQIHTQTDYHILFNACILRHNHKRIAYLAASMVELSLQTPCLSCTHIVNDRSRLKPYFSL